MVTHKFSALLLITVSLLSASCAAPYLHRNAVLGLSTAEIMDSRFGQEALMFTFSLPMQSSPNAASQNPVAKQAMDNQIELKENKSSIKLFQPE